MVIFSGGAVSPSQLGNALAKAFTSRLGCSNDRVLVQTFVSNACELRLFVRLPAVRRFVPCHLSTDFRKPIGSQFPYEFASFPANRFAV